MRKEKPTTKHILHEEILFYFCFCFVIDKRNSVDREKESRYKCTNLFICIHEERRWIQAKNKSTKSTILQLVVFSIPPDQHAKVGRTVIHRL